MTETTATLTVPRRIYYGWVIVGVAALAMVGTLPGRTQGLGLITEPLLADLGIGRVAYAQVNLFATLVGALFAYGVGSLLDRRGSRVVLTAIAILLGLVVLAHGWRLAWAAIGLALVAGLAPMAWTLVRATPDTIGEVMDGDRAARPEAVQNPAPVAAGEPLAASATLAEALRSPAFWVFGLASSMYGLVASGIGLFNEAILAERGFEPGVYHTALAVTAITGLAGNIVGGAWAERGSFRPVLVSSMVMLSAALAGLPHVATPMHVMAQAVVMGVAGGFVMVVFFSFWGRAFGDGHLGRIQGAAQVMTVLGSAVGPLALAWCVEATGSYAVAFYVLAAMVAALALGAVLVRMPRRA